MKTMLFKDFFHLWFALKKQVMPAVQTKRLNAGYLIRNFMFLMLLSLVLGCESPLSDVEINDAKLLAPHFKVIRERDNNDRLECRVELWIKDKNGNTVELKKGNVKVNDQEMYVEREVLTSAPYYKVGIKDVGLGEQFDFEVELSDGKVYTASITTFEKDLGSFSAPKEHAKGNSMQVSWQEAFAFDYLQLNIQNEYKEDENVFGWTFKTIEFQNDTKLKASYTIDKSEFDTHPKVHRSTLTIKAVKEGTVDKNFRGGSKSESIFSYEKSVEIK
jgi:hypothetical protein